MPMYEYVVIRKDGSEGHGGASVPLAGGRTLVGDRQHSLSRAKRVGQERHVKHPILLRLRNPSSRAFVACHSEDNRRRDYSCVSPIRL